ncbi:MAG: peptidylprolyl isomerase [Gemmataceae bacterium]
MPIRRILTSWLKSSKPARRQRRALGMETLEAREVPAVVLRTPFDTQLPDDRPLYLPVTVTNQPAGAVTVTATTNSPNVKAEVVSGGRTIKLDVTGTDRQGQAFSGSMTMRLFENVAPLATNTIIELVNEGFYNGKLFHRIIDDFVIQGGSPNGDGIGGSTKPDVRDEFAADVTFASLGLVAMANARDDNNNSQFFITDIDRTLSERTEFLNFNHSIVGLLTSGFDIYDKIVTTNVDSRDKPLQDVTITAATVITDTTNAVVKLTPSAGVSGPVAVTITANDGTGATTQNLSLNTTPVTVNSRAFLNPVNNVTIASGSTGTLQLSGVDIDNDTLTYAVGVPGNLTGTPQNATVSVNSSGLVSINPTADFRGTFQLLVGVRDQTNRSSSLSSSDNFDTEVLTVTVQDPTTSSTALSISQATIQPNAQLALTATVTATGTITGTVEFFADGTSLGSSAVDSSSGVARLTTTFATTGARSLTARYTSAVNTIAGSTSAPVNVSVTTDAPANIRISATGSNPGSEPRVRVTNQDGTERFNFLAYEASFTGGTRVATADITNDGQEDIIVTPGFGGAPLIRMYDGVTGNLTRELMVFENTFRGGLYVSVGDVLNKGYSQVLVGAGYTGGPRVTLFDNVQNKVVLNYFAYDSNLRTGVSISISDLQANGVQQIITGAGKDAGPVVKVFNPITTNNFPEPSQIGASFLGGDAADRQGIRVGAGGVVNNRRNILTGVMEPDSAPLDRSFDPVEQGVFVG